MEKLKVVLSIELDDNVMRETGVSTEQVKQGLRLYRDDVADGFQLTTCIEGFDASVDYFLESGRIVETEIV